MSTAATAAATSGLDASAATFLAGAFLAGALFAALVVFFAAGAFFAGEAFFAAGDFFAGAAFFVAAFLDGDDLAAGAFLAGVFFAALLFLAGDFLAAGFADFLAAFADEELVTVFSVFAVDFLAGDALVTEVFFEEFVAFLSTGFFPPGRRRVIERREGPVAGFTGTINLSDR
jgi:hypothetical protein